MASTNSSLALLSHDLFVAVPRLVRKAGAFALNYMPDQLDFFSGSFIASKTSVSNSSILAATGQSTASSMLWYSSTADLSATATATSSTLPASTSASPSSASVWFPSLVSGVGAQNMNSFEGVFSYFASRWAISTFIIAIVLNRARAYSASRRRLVLNWYTRLALRIVPILLFLAQLHRVLQTMHCQTGSLLPVTKINSTDKAWNSQFTHESGPLHTLSSTLLFGQNEYASCVASGLISATGNPALGSSSILWPMFLCLCLSHLIETMSCALEGRHPVPETAMTLFEHSLAFAEAEAVVRNSVGLGLFGPLKSVANPDFLHFTRSMVLQRLNVPPEVLLIALISSCSHLSNHIIGSLGLQSKCRLVNTTIWGTSFIAAFLWSFIRYASSMNGSDVGVLRYPTIVLIGFVPHVVILASILVCATIYGVSLLVTLISPPTPEFLQTSFQQRLWLAKDNLQASVAMSNIHLRWSDEFYTTLLKVGFNVLTAASEAVYFNEGISVAISRSTWLENQRIDQISKTYPFRGQMRQVTVPAEIEGALDVAEGLNLVDAVSQVDLGNKNVCGYARERKTAKVSIHAGTAATREDGVGGSQRSGRWYMSWALVKQDILLLARILAKIVVRVLDKVAPWLLTSWILEFANPVEAQVQKAKRQKEASLPPPKAFWIKVSDGTFQIPSNTNIDVEAEMRERLGTRSEAGLTDYLYNWWKINGTWGEIDESGDYIPDGQDDEDLTSVISDAEDLLSLDGSGWETDSDMDAGQRTPTQSNPGSFSRESSVAPENFLGELSRLLDPQTAEDKHEARLLASRLGREGIMTRSQYAHERSKTNLRLLAGRAYPFNNDTLTPQEEEEIFEKILLARRTEARGQQNRSWSEGGEGLGDGGPQCVVCQSSPRTILVWPCRCLCLCEECRVSLALNNFGNCVTCRRDVVAFSRLYVP